ncbi:MAG: protein kinase, partial [Anaerolineae bacterium]|nr:protein kinase [Anaerolineae bacterium]
MADLVGTLLDHFKIVELLGLGGMGAVYKARDVRLQRDVALKVMHPHIAEQADFKARFLQEARSAAKLDHTGIVKVHYFGQVDQLLYIVMQFIPGANLREMLEVLREAGKWVPLDEAVQLVRQVSLALDYAHHRGVLHRDIKPKNIMIDPEPANGLPYHPVITDLGLAKLADSDLVTRAGSSMGTPAYMSPEQALGRPTDRRSDVYSLGVLLYELSVGRVPFPAKTITEAIRYHTQEAPPAPRSIRPDLPEPLERAILQALEKRPERRFSEAAELAQALVGVMAAAIEVAAKPSALADVVSLITQYEQSLVKPRGASILKEFDTPTDVAQDAIQVMVDGRTVATVPVVGSVTSIGRLDRNDIVLADSRASRHHAQVTFDGADYRVVDLDSSNGTFLANVRLLPGVPEVWTPDRAMRIGETWLHLARADEPAATPLPGTRAAAAGPAVPAHSQDAGAGSGVGRVGLLVENTAPSVTPGESVPVTLVVLNQGPLVDHFEVSVEGIPADWVSASVPLIHLLPGQQRAVSLVIRPPRSPQARAGAHPLVIRVTSQSEPGQSALVDATLTVAAYYQYDLSMRPSRQRGVAVGTFTVQIDNHSNADLTVRLDAVDPEDGCRYTLAPPYLAVPVGRAQKGELTVLPKAPLRGETDIMYPFTVTARPDEAPELSRQAQGTWVHTPPAYEVSLRPEAPRGTTQGTFGVQVVNVGQAALTLALEA